MDLIVVIMGVVALLSVAFSVRLYVELRRWSNICKHGRIAIAYNRKVQLQAPLTEWYLWTRKLEGNENGRVVYRNGKVTVAIVKPVVPPGRIHRMFHRKRDGGPAQAQSRQGTWSMKQDKPS